MSETLIWVVAGLAVVGLLAAPRVRARLRTAGLRGRHPRGPHRLRRDRTTMVGCRGLVLQQVDRKRGGRIRVAGETWAARTPGGELAPGTRVEVVQVHGGTAQVRRVAAAEAERP